MADSIRMSIDFDEGDRCDALAEATQETAVKMRRTMPRRGSLDCQNP